MTGAGHWERWEHWFFGNLRPKERGMGVPWGRGCNILPAERRHRASPWQRNLGYPLAMLGLLALTVSVPGWVPTLSLSPCALQDPADTLTPSSSSSFSSQGISVLIVCFHVLELLLDDAAMPRGIQVPGGGHRGQRGAPSAGLLPTKCLLPCRMRPWARSPSPSSAPSELPCRSSSSCILHTGTGGCPLPPALSPVPPPLSPPLSSP